MNEAVKETWSARTLQRNISSQYYHRLLQSQHKDLVEKEMLQITESLQKTDKLEFVKNPVVAEFLGLASRPDFMETELETAIINNLQKQQQARWECTTHLAGIADQVHCAK